MKTSLDHLPGVKQKRLARFVQILREEFDDKLSSATSGRRKRGRILKIILYGSHATGKWVEDKVSGYWSDYDLLVIVNDESFTDITDYWSAAIDRMEMEAMREGVPGFAAMPQVIVHSLEDVNSQLADGRYFFRDIVAEGIELYALEETKGGNRKHALAEARDPDPGRAEEMAKDYYELWSGKARDFLKVAELTTKEGLNNNAAFNLHQAAESAYTCYLLTKTLYSPATHNLLFLRSQCETREESLREIWPNAKPYKRRFELLKKAYIEARYSKHYAITTEELAWLKERVEMLLERVEGVCGEGLESE